VVFHVQIPVQVSHIPSTPHAGNSHHEQAEVAEMVPMKVPFQGLKKLVKRTGYTYDAEHGSILRFPPARGKWVHSFSIPGGLPFLPLLSSSRAPVLPKSQST
jgi:hypothetical protein